MVKMANNQSNDTRERQKFLQFLTNDGAINAGAVGVAFEDGSGIDISLEKLRATFGDNFNTLIVLNTGVPAVNVMLDGEVVTSVNGSNGSFSFDWKDGIVYNTLAFKNIDGATALANETLRITVGRTGVN